jgi:multiple sugar transport system ATP-binding protein
MSAVSFRGTWKVYEDGTPAVRDLSLDIDDGELLVLIGPSGCGKSTALRMVAGLEEITAGDIVFGERRVNDLSPKERNVAMVFQNYALYPHMSVRANIEFSLKLSRMTRAERRQRVERVAETLGLGDLLERKPAKLSGGQRQRVAMGRAIVRDPAVFLLDEPLSNLDAKLRVQMRAEITELQARLGATMIFVTHDQTEAMTMAHRIAVLRRGVLQQVGTPQALYADPANLFVAEFIGSPAMNLLAGVLEVDGGKTSILLGDRVRIPLGPEGAAHLGLPAGREVIAGMRPEHLALANGEFTGPRIRGRVRLVEPLGAETIVHMTVDAPAVVRDELREVAEDVDPMALADLEHQVGSRFTLRLFEGSVPRPGETLDLAVPTERLYFFDPETGAALGRNIRAAAVPTA